MDEQTFAATFKHSPVRRTKYSGLQRNLSWALSNDVALAEVRTTTSPSNTDPR
jgi:epoxyqueuosine reductase QueG